MPLGAAVRARCAAIALLCTFAPVAQSEEYIVDVTVARFTPDTVSVRPGDTVTWVNDGVVAHQLYFRRDPRTAGASPLNRVLSGNGSFSVTADRIGVFQYVCRWHGMFGEIRVTAPEQGRPRDRR